jgi:glycerate kinase
MVNNLAVIEMARASGLSLAGGNKSNDPINATTRGTGELVVKAIENGARRVIVAVGGSASTDGGFEASEVLERFRPLDGSRGYTVVVACDVRSSFVSSAAIFGPQKGATPEQVAGLYNRLESLVDLYLRRYGFDVSELVGAGAAGGLAGGLAALGANLVPGVDLVAAEVGLEQIIRGADLVITGEGRLDGSSFDGKVVGGVLRMASRLGVRVHTVVGDATPEVRDRIPLTTLVDLYGRQRALSMTTTCINECISDFLQEN